MTKSVLIEGIGVSELEELLAKVLKGEQSVDSIPDFTISTSQVQEILGISYETVVLYTEKNLIKNLATSRKQRPRYSFIEIIEFRKQLPEILRKRK